ncbi:MAG: DUF167 domain-containing protein [Pseudomonadota bacterium]|nr:DUF167 domain-containing protein [Pseudomonadota bacterium]
MILGVHVKPNARQSRVVGFAPSAPGAGRTVILAIAAPPVDGKANEEVVRFIAKALGLPRSSVTIERGTSGRIKHLSIPDGTSLAPLGEPPEKS